MKQIITIALILVFSTFTLAQANSDAPVRVTFLHVNDVYQFMPVEGGKKGGLARLMTLRKQASTLR